MLSNGKYSRTSHYLFSPGTTSDDRQNHQWFEDICKLNTVVHTEKLDGENNCLNGVGVFARSHGAITTHPWSNYLKVKHNLMKKDLIDLDLEIFGENLYAKHSIEYTNIDQHFYVFAVRQDGMWLSWEEVCMWAGLFDFPTVPLLGYSYPKQMFEENGLTPEQFTKHVLSIVKEPSTFNSIDTYTGKNCTMEGIVTRNALGFSVDLFKENVFKYVRSNHVKTDKHWIRNWKRAPLNWEKKI